MSTTKARRPLPMNTSYWHEETPSSSSTTPFTTSYPSALPRRQPPSLNDATLFDSYDDGGSATFRNADSTARALAALSQSKYEQRERKRALSLLGMLVMFAVMMHVASSGYLFGDGVGDGDGDNGSFRNPKVTGVDGMSRENDDEDGSGGGGDNVEEKEVDVVEEEDDEFFVQLNTLGEFSDDITTGDIPFFWHVPRCAGSTVKDILGKCLRLTQASEVGARDGHGQDESLGVVDFKGEKYVNVDTTSLSGIERAISFELGPSGLADVITSSYLFQISNVFSRPSHLGKSFTMLRHPVERAVSMYYLMQQEDAAMVGVPLVDYARGNGIENNWMVRYLVNQMEGELEKEALDKAKEVLKRKFVIGLLEEKEESISRFQKYFEWKFSEDENDQMKEKDCIADFLESGTQVNENPEAHEMPKKGSQEWALITHQTQYDIKLYDFAVDLFTEQGKKLGTKKWKKAMKKKNDN
eukprot:CAMPEP_0195519026 /NCGR_PEP_ID=MMETSP0794_2-20130614/14208_1 /TAXON_ID=515487 /ORGANISM="Stephanopyxis turris, Strain CCMP 815" /LENGTH=468 /DNA_ID=CAMNT_0040648101 /DNA_START=66 /DNA_END=1472 /DNA_ORIENTATION=+